MLWGAGRQAFGAYLGVGECTEPLWNGDGYVNGMNALGLPMPGKREERHVAIGACIQAREHSLGGVAEVVPCI